jgi:DNA adenine methylase
LIVENFGESMMHTIEQERDVIIEEQNEENISDLPLFNKIDPMLPKSKPFVKWAGGKRNLLYEILPRFPKEFKQYYEPFIGGGAVFFAVYDRLQHAFISDTNLELIITYTVIQNNPDVLIEKLKFHASHHSKDYYYAIRAQDAPDDPIELAARFLYLNKTCYNGLYRVNKAGKFNTPMGSYKNPNIVQEENIWLCHEALQNVSIRVGEFDSIQPQKGDFVYFDPPYHPTSDISFTEYTRSNFTEQDQLRLRDFAVKLHRRGVYVIISNSKTNFIENAYKLNGFHILTVQAPRYVNCKPNDRGAIAEVLITNF